MSGFAAIYRATLDHPLFRTDMARLGAWTWLIMRAAWKPVRYDIKGKIIMLERGQLCASRSQLAKAWGWSPSAVERYLTRLQTEQMIGRATGQGKSVITICNYAKYQDLETEAGQATGQVTGQASDRHRTTKEQGNKGTGKQEPKGSMPKRASKLPDIWFPKLTAASLAIVETWPAGKLEQEERAFRDHAADKGRTSKDWQAAFRTWINNADKWMKEKSNGANNRNGSGNGADKRSGLARAIDAELAQLEATFP